MVIIKRCLTIILSALFLVTTASIAAPVVIKAGEGVYRLENYADIYHDKTKQLTVDQVSDVLFAKNFTPYDYKSSIKYRDLTTWLKFSIYNPLPNPVYLFLNGDNNYDHSWKFFTQNAQGTYVQNPSSKGLHIILFPLQIPADSTQVYYLQRFTQGKNAANNFVVEDQYTYALNAIDRYLAMGLNYGIQLALIIYSIFIYFLIRDKNYLIYIMFVASYVAGAMLDDGILNRVPIFHINNWWFLHMLQFALASMGFFYGLFAKNVLRAKKYAPRLNFAMNCHAFLYIPLVLLTVTIYNEYIFILYGLFALIFAAILNIITMLKGYRPAKYYFVGMMFLIIGSVILLLENEAYLPRNFITENAEFGLCLDMILQSIALAARFNLFREEEAKAQTDLIKQRDVNVKVQAEAIKAQQQLIEGYERFVPHDFLELLQRKSIVDIQLGDKVEKEMSVLFSDIRNFTTVLEGKTPRESIKYINDYNSKVGPIIREYHGFVDKYIGDAIMAVFEQSPNNPVDAGIRMIKALDKTRSNNSEESIEIGIGIHYGSLMVAIVGEKLRMDGTVISDTVNTTFRLEELNKVYGTHIIISEKVFNLINRERFKIRFLDHIYTQEKIDAIKIFEVFDADPPELIQKKLAIHTDFEKALEYYRNRDFENATVYLQRCQKILPDDRLLALYMQRCEKFMREGYAQDWQPIIRVLQKGNFELW